MNNTCRMCGKGFENKLLLPLYQSYKPVREYPINIVKKFNLVHFMIFEDDGLPQQMCMPCFEEFKSINAFLELCIEAQNNLKNEYRHFKIVKVESRYKTNDLKDDQHIKHMKPKSRNTEATFEHDFPEIEIEIVQSENDNVILNSNQCKSIDDDELEISYENFHSNYNTCDDDSSEEYFIDNFEEDFTICCKFCQKIFSNANKLDDHQLEKHKKKLYNKYFVCEVCGECIIHYRFAEHIMGKHAGEKLYNCEHCGKGFQKFRAFKDHSIKHHQTDPNKKTYDHKEKHPCPECNRIYLSSAILQNHIKLKHSGIIKNTVNKSNPKPLPTEPSFQCDICKIKFRNIVSMEKHRNNHINEKYEHKFKCSECDRRFGRRDHLKYHIRLEHLKEKPYKCQLCDKSYVIGFQLNYHMKLVHNSDKKRNRVKCENCNKTFHSKSYLLRHQKEAHSFDAQFTCVICNEAFFKQAALIRHSKVHNIQIKLEKLDNYLENDSPVKDIVIDESTSNKGGNIDQEIEVAVSILTKNDVSNIFS